MKAEEMRIPSGQRFACVQAGGRQEARDRRAELDAGLPGTPQGRETASSRSARSGPTSAPQCT